MSITAMSDRCAKKPRVLVQNKVYQTESENDDGAQVFHAYCFVILYNLLTSTQIIPVSGTVDSVVDRSLASDVKSAEIANAEEAFTSFYLRQMTTEFAEDLDKIRSAGDFNNRSIGMLVNALKQSNSCFANDERINIGRSIIVKNA